MAWLRFCLMTLLLGIAEGEALAGAWPRAEGTAFVAFSASLDLGAGFSLPESGLKTRSGLYAEYGVTERWTAGLDAAYATEPESQTIDALLFLRRPVWQGERDIVALDFGLGTRIETGQPTEIRVRPGVAWGRGFQSSWGDGWFGVDASVDHAFPDAQTRLKLDATAGLKPTETWMLILALQTYHETGEAFSAKLAPSIVRRISGSTHLQLGITVGIAGNHDVAVKFGNWVQF